MESSANCGKCFKIWIVLMLVLALASGVLIFLACKAKRAGGAESSEAPGEQKTVLGGGEEQPKGGSTTGTNPPHK